MSDARCPQCQSEFQGRGSHFPFCSERCKLLDLGAWASERYSIPAVELDPQESVGTPTTDQQE
jgi:endogenous inhibitor of DNA gyrase (YacG/DUF329 family)